jgi:LuxR family maltose regulon positive regulatory protein
MAYLGRLVREFELDTDVRSKRTSRLTPGLVVALSTREHEVLNLLAAGKENREIADELYVTRNTVKKHITHILDKLGAANRTQAVARARELGLLA